MRYGIVLVALIVALVSATPASANSSYHSGCGASPVMKVIDVALVRPPALVGAVASSGVWIALSPLLKMIGVADSLGHHMVVRPWQFTGGRHAGCFRGPEGYQPGS
ncbi:MAG: hypothetical protein GY725_00320 [bacterium]|nr:hypothetical protein [bacterium]